MTALTLASKGIPCTLVDKATFPRDKICGDALSGKVVEVFKKLDPGLVDRMAGDPTHLGSWGVNFVAPNTKMLRVPFRKDFSHDDQAPGFIAKRIDFDDFLVEEVRKNELVDLREGVALEVFRRENGEWVLENKAGTQSIRSKLVIAADGAYSRFAKEFGAMKMEPNH